MFVTRYVSRRNDDLKCTQAVDFPPPTIDAQCSIGRMLSKTGLAVYGEGLADLGILKLGVALLALASLSACASQSAAPTTTAPPTTTTTPLSTVPSGESSTYSGTLTISDAEAAIVAANLGYTLQLVSSYNYPINECLGNSILGFSPGSGSRVPPGTIVAIQYCNGSD